MLTEHQLGFFARNGFLQVSNCVSPEVCAALVDRTWEKLPATWLRQSKGSWTGTVKDSCHAADVRIRRGHLKFQKGDLVNDPLIEAAFGRNSELARLTQALIGAPLTSMCVRGLYCIIPLSDDVTFPTMQPPHIEAHPTQLVCLCYLDDVLAGGGGLLVWPGSHREIYPAMSSRVEFAARPTYPRILRQWTARLPHELSGKRGDIVIIHHRLLHAPSINRSDNIRFGFLCDYHRADFRSLSALPPGDDLWEDWPTMNTLGAKLRNGEPDLCLKPRRRAFEVPSLSYCYHKFNFWKREVSLTHPPDISAAYVKKHNASILARSRKEGDIWLLISDDPSTASERQLHPRGSSWHNTSLKVTVDRVPVKSQCYYDFIRKLPLSPGDHMIEISGVDRQAYLRVLRMRLPFDQSHFLFKVRLSPTDMPLRLCIQA